MGNIHHLQVKLEAVLIQGYVEVSSAISCLECRNEGGVIGGIVWVTFTTCMFILKLPWPLSPPSFTHTSLEGMVSCQVRPLGDLFERDTMKSMVIQDGESTYSRW